MRYFWSFDEVDKKLDDIMVNIFNLCQSASNEYNYPKNYVVGANIAAFKKVSEGMISQGII